MTSETLVLTEEMEKLLNRIEDDLVSTLVNLSGSLKGIECGTHIKIPTAVGYVSYYKSAEDFSTIQIYLKEKIQEEKQSELEDYNTDEET